MARPGHRHLDLPRGNGAEDKAPVTLVRPGPRVGPAGFALFTLGGLDIGFWQTWFALSIRTILFTIPIQGIAGIGTGQAWWSGALLLQGVNGSLAVAAGLTLQAIDLAVSLPVAGIGSTLLFRRNRDRSSEEPGGDGVSDEKAG